jgi:hypothetical protein
MTIAAGTRLGAYEIVALIGFMSRCTQRFDPVRLPYTVTVPSTTFAT